MQVCMYMYVCVFVYVCINTYMGRGVGGVCIMYINITLFMFNNMRIDCIVLISLYMSVYYVDYHSVECISDRVIWYNNGCMCIYIVFLNILLLLLLVRLITRISQPAE